MGGTTDDLRSASQAVFKPKNKDRRHAIRLRQKKALGQQKREERFRRRKEEDKNPKLRADRQARNIPATIDRKRVWDDVGADEGDSLGLSIDLERLKRQKVASEEGKGGSGLTENNLQKLEKQREEASEDEGSLFSSEDDDLGSLLESSEEGEDLDGEVDQDVQAEPAIPPADREGSPAASTTSTNLSFIPDALAAKFPTLFHLPPTPKILVTTSLNSILHDEAYLLTTLFPNSNYVRRTRHKYNSHHFSLREIAKFASNREYTSVVVLTEDQKRPSGITVMHLPVGPTFHFSISNWVEGRRLPGHGKPTEHIPELILNNFRTPLGLLTAHLFRTMFPPQPELQGRQVLTLHNQRDYIFVRRHRYVFRDKRATEKSVIAADGKPMKGVEDIRAGLQELGPRFTLKLRRIDKGIQRASGQEWEWKGKMDKQRTKFQL